MEMESRPTAGDLTRAPQQVSPSEAHAPKKGLQRLTGVLFAPVDAFRDIAQRPDIVTPLAAIVLLSIVMTVIAVPRLDFETTIREQLTESNRRMSPDDLDRMVRFSTAFARAAAYVSPLLNLIFFAIIAGVLLLAFRLFGGEGTFKQAFSVSLYAWIPLLIGGIIGTIVLLARGTVTADEMTSLVMSNPGFLVDAKESRVAFALLSSLDIFTIWTVVLFVIGFSFVSGMSRARSAAIVLTLWGVLIAFKVGAALIGSMSAGAA